MTYIDFTMPVLNLVCRSFIGIGVLLLSGCIAHAGPTDPERLYDAPATPPRKNVILFIGDGMGISTITAARIYEGQLRGESGEENALSFERFPNVALVKTYNTNQQVPDSAGTATAMNTGVKTRAGVIGVGPQAQRGNCVQAQDNILPNAAQAYIEDGKSVGIVTTARLTHATPAAVYGHSPERDWEADSDIPESERDAGCIDLATQLTKLPFAVALGGGRAQFFGKDLGGTRLGANDDLTAEWTARASGHYVEDISALSRLDKGAQPLLGLFANGHMTYMLDRGEDTSEPTLSQMTAAAIERLELDTDGYFLMVEGGRIDHGHHEGRAAYALSETVEFARAVGVALEKVDLTETLILVTADHSHVFTIAGYPTRGNPILGLVKGNDSQGEPRRDPTLAVDGYPYTTLGYMNGPGAKLREARSAPDQNPLGRQQALVPTGTESRISETHGGEDVALYAIGPGAEKAHGVMEQNEIFYMITSLADSDSE